MDVKKLGFSTRAVHAGEEPCPTTGAHVTPIYQTSTFVLAGKIPRYFYTRHGNPTHAVLEEKMKILEGGGSALATASGMAALLTVMLTSLEKGDKVLSSEAIYGGTYNMLKFLLPKFGVEPIFIDMRDPANVKRTLDQETKVRIVFFETPANPTLDIIDIEKISRVARDAGADVVVDNTLMTPYYQRPLELGADIVVYSATKYLSGHGDTLGGIVVGKEEFITEARRILAVTGSVISPFNAWLIIRGLKTLSVRMEKHSENAMKVARFLDSHPKVRRVLYPGLSTHPQYKLARQQMRGFGGMVAFEIDGDTGDVYEVLEGLKLCRCAVSLGDVSTLIEHPASMTHRSIPEEERVRIGITEGLMRISVGIEDADDVIADLNQALSLLS